MTRPIDETFALIAALMQRGENFCVATVVRTEDATSAKAGAKAIVLADGSIRGFLGGGCVQGALKRSAAAVLRDGKPRLIRVKPKDAVTGSVDADGTELHRSFCPSGGTVDLFLEPMRPAPRIILCGASPVALALADLAPRLGYRVALAALPEDHAQFAAVEPRVRGFDLAPLAVAPEDWLVVATQGKRDRDALAAALASDAVYIAFVGSRRKAETLLAELGAKSSIPPDRLARLKAPAGLDIHGIEPAEIALSILAEITTRRRSALRSAADAESATAEN